MNIKELNNLRRESQRLWLHGWWLLMETDNCLRECNGCGAEWMPKWIRTFLDCILQLFAPAVAIHDMRYFKHEGDRHKWDDEFEANCRMLARDKFSWYNPLLWISYFVASRLRVALTIGGEIAWKQSECGV